MLVAIAIQIAKDLTVEDVGLPPDTAGAAPQEGEQKKYFERKKEENVEIRSDPPFTLSPSKGAEHRRPSAAAAAASTAA